MMLTRRKLIGGMGLLFAAPAVAAEQNKEPWKAYPFQGAFILTNGQERFEWAYSTREIEIITNNNYMIQEN